MPKFGSGGGSNRYNSAAGYRGGIGGPSVVGPKPINLPSANKVTINMEHVLSGHVKGGSRVSAQKTLFPENMNPNQIQKAIKDSFKSCKKLETQGERVLLEGVSRDNLRIQMWLNRTTKTIETAYPVY